MMSEGLKSCPYCGGTDIEFRFHPENKTKRKQAYGGMYCRTEGCGGAVVFHAYDAITKRHARKICTAKWNRRAGDES